MKNNDDLKQEINNLKKEFNFREHYDLEKSLKELKDKYNLYQESRKTLQVIRPARIRKKISQLTKHLTELENLLNQDDEHSLYQFVTDTQNYARVNKFINNDLPEFKKSIEKKLIEAKILSDIGGVKHGSMQKFLIINLLMIYVNGSSEDIQIHWDRANEAGKGTTFSYLIKMRRILPSINPEFHLSNSDKHICNTAGQLLTRFHDSLSRTKK